MTKPRFEIRELVWRKLQNQEDYFAETLFGSYWIKLRADGMRNWDAPGGLYGMGCCESIDEAKAAAQAHYNERLMPALILEKEKQQ